MTWPQLQLLLGSAIIGACVQYIVFVIQRAKLRKESVPDELHKEVETLRTDVVGLRVEIARIKGQLNFKTWRKD